MSTVRLMGGLGNQMFQYAFMRAKSLRDNTSCSLDRSFIDIKKSNASYTLRNFELNYFNIEAKFSNALLTKMYFLIDRILTKLRISSIVRHEGSMRFNPSHMTSKALFFNGYFQCEKYFLDFENQIRKDFIPKVEMSEIAKVALKNIEVNKENAVSVHIRRGDYVTLAAASSVHGTCSKEYYLEAMKLIKTRVENPRFYFFSDDIDWVKNEFKSIENAYFVENDSSKKSFEDMILMSHCHSNIIANSSYSWWGAWLNTNKNKLVIAPSKWFNLPHVEYDDILPESWMKI